MNYGARVVAGPRRARRPAARTAAATIATAGLAVLTACGGSPSSAASGGSPNAAGAAKSPSAVAYSHCIRSHGVPNFPDPPSGGGLPKGSAQEFGVSSSRLSAARRACQRLLPAAALSVQQCESTGDCPRALVQRAMTVMLKYSRCLRAHGVPNWPDPTIDSQGRPFFDVSRAGITHQYTHSSLFESKDRECERQVGGSAGVPVPLG